MMSNVMLDLLKYLLFGAIIGIANIVPGLSGGTFAVILNIYDRLIRSIATLRTQFIKSMQFLIPIVLGAGMAIIASSKGIKYLLEHHTMVLNFFFVGVIVGSIPMIYKRATKKQPDGTGMKSIYWLSSILSFSIMVIFLFIPSPQEKLTNSMSFFLLVQLFFGGFLAAVAMLIPGISGSFMLLLMGVYGTIIEAVSDMNIIVLIPVGFGVIAGLLLGSKLILWLLNHIPNVTYLSILGFVIGSIPLLLQKTYLTDPFRQGGTWWLSIVGLLMGVGLTVWFDHMKIKESRQYDEKEHRK